MKANKEYYIKNSYRGYNYYATYTNAQYKALDSLLLFLCREFDITHSFIDKDKRLDILSEEPKAGIVSHINYRSNKVDVSPAMN